MKPVFLKKKSSTVTGNVILNGSKAISNRLLMMEALSYSSFEFNNVSLSEDTQLLKFYLSFFDACANSRIAMIVDTGNAGAVMRFIMAYASIREGKWLITGHERLREHSINPLVDSLRKLGAEIIYTEKKDLPPVKIIGKSLVGGDVSIDAQQSSHFVSALMLIAPYLSYGLTINLKGKPVSKSYIMMTAYLMRQAGIDIEMDNDAIRIQPGNYNLKSQVIEPDWNNASYWYEVAALAEDTELFLEGMGKESIQGEKILAELYENFGVKTSYEDAGIRLSKTGTVTPEFTYDFTDFPDLALPVIVTCAALGIKGSFLGLNRERIKESTRIKALVSELRKIGTSLHEDGDRYVLEPSGKLKKEKISLDADNDHRLAMSFAPLAYVINEVEIFSPGTVKKSYPGFWKDINNFGVDVSIPEGICS
jgi:3-phosphoshikimate 1-carboxyvinyltransferase